MRVGARARLHGVLLLAALAVPARAEEKVDLSAVHRIKTEAFQNSQVMDHMFFLTDRYGPRLTASPGYRAAADWAVARIKEWGIPNARLEKWGTFGRGWTLVRFSAHLREPVYAPLAGMPLAWSSGTRGPVTGEVFSAPLFPDRKLEAERYDLEKYAARIKKYSEEQKGRLRGKVVLIDTPRELKPPTEPASERLDEKGLATIATAPEPYPVPPLEWPVTKMPEDPAKREQYETSLPLTVADDFWQRQSRIEARLYAFLHEEGVLAVLSADRRGDGGILFAENAGSWEPDAPVPPPVISLLPEPYDRIARLVDRKVPVKVDLEVEVTFTDGPQEGLNVVAEIPGGKKKDEVVMLGGHLDSWHAGTGATDNAAGCSVALEALRILKSLNLPMERTVRLALWSGEEQGLFGSRGYVKSHFADPMTMEVRPEHSRFAGYFNVDNGTGKIRGVYLQGNDMVRPIFESWLAPFHDLGATTLTIANTGGTDHLSFDEVGLPGFQFIQDPLDYESRTHHSNLDVYDHVVASDLMQASAILASFVYDAATRAEMLPRKPLPKPLPKKKEVDL